MINLIKGHDPRCTQNWEYSTARKRKQVKMSRISSSKKPKKMTNEPMRTELLNLECWVPQVSGWSLPLPQSGLILLEPVGICVYDADSFLLEAAETLSKNPNEF